MTPWWLYLVGLVPLVVAFVASLVMLVRARRPNEPAALESASRAANERRSA